MCWLGVCLLLSSCFTRALMLHKLNVVWFSPPSLLHQVQVYVVSTYCRYSVCTAVCPWVPTVNWHTDGGHVSSCAVPMLSMRKLTVNMYGTWYWTIVS